MLAIGDLRPLLRRLLFASSLCSLPVAEKRPVASHRGFTPAAAGISARHTGVSPLTAAARNGTINSHRSSVTSSPLALDLIRLNRPPSPESDEFRLDRSQAARRAADDVDGTHVQCRKPADSSVRRRRRTDCVRRTGASSRLHQSSPRRAFLDLQYDAPIKLNDPPLSPVELGRILPVGTPLPLAAPNSRRKTAKSPVWSCRNALAVFHERTVNGTDGTMARRKYQCQPR